ncbi:MAG: hypothetical protein ACYTEP_07295 [Planctomycetota bacterium]|jgi:hypothetical protein
MKTLLVLLCCGGLAFATNSPHVESPGQALSSGSSQVVMIEGVGEPGEGWVEIAPAGSAAVAPGSEHGLVKIPFSVLGNTKILVNMEHAAWVYAVGQETKVHELHSSAHAGTVVPSDRPMVISGLKVESFLEVTLNDGVTKTLEGGHQYLFPQDGFQWMKLPADAHARLLKD